MKDTIQQEKEYSIESIPEPKDIGNVIYSLMVNPNLSSINYFNDFKEAGISPETIGEGDGDEIGLFDIDEAGTSMAISTHAFHHHLQNDPQKATEILISRAARKMLCAGVRPIAVSAFLYHINYADPKGQYIASKAKAGLENAAGKFNLKISDKKIRFDYFTGHGPVMPTLIISLVGMVDDKNKIVTHAFKEKGGNIFLMGRSVEDIGSSEYLEFYHGIANSPLPVFSIDQELRVQMALKELHALNLVRSASPVGKGGLFFTLLRSAIPSGLGFDITTDAETRIDSFLFGESMGRILLEVDPSKEDDFVDFMFDKKYPFFTLGHITKGEIRIDDTSYGFIDKMTPAV